MTGTDICGKFIPLGDWGDLVDEYRKDSKGPIVTSRRRTPTTARSRRSSSAAARRGVRLGVHEGPRRPAARHRQVAVPGRLVPARGVRAAHHVFSEAARMLGYARLMSNRYWSPDFESVQKRASILEIRDGFLRTRGAGHGIMNFQSKEQLNMEFILNAEARVIDKSTVEAAGRTFTARALALAAGARPTPPDVPGVNLHGVINFATMLDPHWFDFEPNRCVVIGGGKTAIEYGSFFQATGCRTTILTRSKLMRTAGLKHVDENMRLWVENAMKRRGIVIRDGMEPVAILGEEHVTGVRYRNMTTGEEFTEPCDMVFLGTGERPSSAPFVEVLGGDGRGGPRDDRRDDADVGYRRPRLRRPRQRPPGDVQGA